MDDLFAVHKLNEKGLEKAQDIAAGFDKLLQFLEAVIPEPSREMSVVKTHLETACFFAKKAMAKRYENQAV